MARSSKLGLTNSVRAKAAPKAATQVRKPNLVGIVLLVMVLPVAHFAAHSASDVRELHIDFQERTGLIRPLHGVNSGPLCYRGTVDLSAQHRELGIPLTRLHDVPWVNAEAVDIHTLFPDFRDDPEDPASYRFAPTDDYIFAITNVPSQIVYRLGESIEHTPRQYFVHPPADPAKWAAICLGIIRHYNEGWAGGFRHNIRYWEIWNEPDVRPNMWTGTDEQFFELYEVTAKAIKARFPDLKVGGPGVGSTGEFVGDTFQPAPFLAKFLAFCRTRQAPLDFLSWHRYTSQPWDLPRRARAVRQLLDRSGFPHAESHLNEWNYLPDDDWAPLVRSGQGLRRERWHQQMAGAAGAAFAACGLILFQDAPLDAANFYTGEVQGFGLFNYHGVPKSNFYAFKAFRELLDTPRRSGTRGEIEGELALLAGLNAAQTRAAILVSNLKAGECRFAIVCKNRPWIGSTHYEVIVVDDTRHFTRVAEGRLAPEDRSISLDLAAPSVALIRLRPAP